MPNIPNPTTKTYTSLDDAFAFFNARLFAGRLPACLLTMQRSKSAYGYFAGGRFGSKDGKEVTDEIALNPSHFRDRSTEQSLSTLVHEMAQVQRSKIGLRLFRGRAVRIEGRQGSYRRNRAEPVARGVTALICLGLIVP